MMFIDHITIIVSNIRRTHNFYSSFLGDPIRMTDSSVVYDVSGTKIFFKTPKLGHFVTFDKDSGGMNHIAFGLEIMEELIRYDNALSKAGIEHSAIARDAKTNKDYIWFDDPDGYRIELYLRGKNRELVTL
jgi:catechol 2,3-dioxygenase-like lactoylglutathione lyase family enzyme